MASPEYITMVKCTPQLTDTIAGDPKRVAESLFAEGYIAPAILEDMQMDTMRRRDKASKLVTSMSDRIKNTPAAFHEFVRLLRDQGPWTNDLVELLNRTYSSLIFADEPARMEPPQVKQEHPQQNPEQPHVKQEPRQEHHQSRQEYHENSLEYQEPHQEDKQYRLQDNPHSDESEDDLDEDNFLSEHRDLVEQNLDRLCHKMEPLKVVTQLRKQGVFTNYDRERVLSFTTTSERNQEVISELYTRGPEAFDKFINGLKSINPQHSELAYTLQPVRYRILWFASSPTLAASVVYALETYGKAKFPEITNRTVDSKYIVRRATIFKRVIKVNEDGDVENMDDVKYANEVEVCLVFPISSKDDLVESAMSASFERVCPMADLVVMSGVCESVGSGAVKEGDLVFIDKGTQSSSEISLIRERLQRLFTNHTNQPPWIRELYSTADSATSGNPRLKMPHFETIDMPNPNSEKPSSTIEAQLPKLDCVDDLPSTFSRDIDTQNFFSICQGKPQFVCQGILGNSERVRDCVSGVGMSCTMRSTCVLMEVCRMFVQKFRTTVK